MKPSALFHCELELLDFRAVFALQVPNIAFEDFWRPYAMANKIYAKQRVIGAAQIVSQSVNLAGCSSEYDAFAAAQTILDILVDIADFRLHIF